MAQLLTHPANLSLDCHANQGTLSHRLHAKQRIMNRRGLTHIPRSLAVIDGLRAASGLSIAGLDEAIAERGYDDVDPLRWPRADTRTAYLKGKRPLPYEATRSGIRSYLEAIERAFPGATAIFFHPFWTLLDGPLATSLEYQKASVLYPSATIKARESVGRPRSLQLADELRQHNRAVLTSARRRRIASPHLSIPFVHLCMCQASREGSTLFSPAGGSPFGVSRRYRPAQDEVAELHQLTEFNALTVALALFLEALLIGDQCRADYFKEATIALTPCLAAEPRFRRAAPVMQRLIEWAIDNSAVRRYTLYEIDTLGHVLPLQPT
jgi:hypothetical protein